MINYPLMMSFKKVAMSPQVKVVDATGQVVAYSKQKAFKFKEDITIFQDEQQQRPLFRIKADRVVDFSARYVISDASGATLGAVQRKGARSLWKANYQILDHVGSEIGLIHEENGWIKMADALFNAVPVLGMFAGYLFNPAYLIDSQGQTVLYLKKQAAFLEGGFKLEQRNTIDPAAEPLILAGTILAVMMERWRG